MFEEFEKEIFKKISEEGLFIGRWKLSQEGTGSYESFVIRDNKFS